VTYKMWIRRWLLDVFAQIKSHNRLQSLGTVSSTAFV
jgi:hypothetical protein